LNAIDITLTATIRNDFQLIFVATPIPTTIYLATTQTADPSVLADPNKVALLTDGPTIVVKGPDNVSQIFGAPATTQPVDVVSRTEPTTTTWSSLLPINDPHFIPPNETQLSVSRTLDLSNAASLLSQFIGAGTTPLFVSSTAFSSFFSDSGNGGGVVLTRASATLTLQYRYTPAAVPEPWSVIHLGLGMSLVFLVSRFRPRAARPAGSDRA